MRSENFLHLNEEKFRPLPQLLPTDAPGRVVKIEEEEDEQKKKKKKNGIRISILSDFD